MAPVPAPGLDDPTEFMQHAQERSKPADKWWTRLRESDRVELEADWMRSGLPWPDYWHFVVLVLRSFRHLRR